MKKIVLVLGAALAGCAAEPVPYHSGNEIPRGPGLLTGPEGAFVVSNIGASAAPRTPDEERDYQEWRRTRQQQQGTTK